MADRVYFIGANTGRGYEHFLPELRPRGEGARVCVVRGAAGTGRHLLLDALAEDWKARGREVIRYAGADGSERTAAVVSGAWADVFCEDENNIVKTWAPKMCSQDEYRIRLMFSSAPLIIHPTAIFRRELLNKHNLRYPEEIKYKYAEDYKMWTQCSACGEIGILEETVIKYREEKSDNRITVRYEKEMAQCGFEIQRDQLKNLDIELTEEMYHYNNQLLMGRKPYDIKYKRWMDLIIKQNAKYNVHSQPVLKQLLYERWYNIVYYGIAYEKSFSKRIKYFNSLYFGQRTKFIISRITKKKPVKF